MFYVIIDLRSKTGKSSGSAAESRERHCRSRLLLELSTELKELSSNNTVIDSENRSVIDMFVPDELSWSLPESLWPKFQMFGY